MRISLRWLSVACALLLAWECEVSPATAAEPIILIDHSGSMAGFHNAGSLKPVVQMLRETILGAPQVLWVVSQPGQPTQLLSGTPPPHYGGETRINEAVQTALDQFGAAASIWLLTDNQPAHELPDQDLDNLYDWLRRSGDKPWAVTLFVLQLPFRGPLYRQTGPDPLDRDYRGDRAVVLYAALLDQGAKEEFRKALERLDEALERQRPKHTFRLRCKPLQEDSVAMEVESGTMERLPDGTLKGKGREGQAFHGTFTLKVRSNLEHVTFFNARPSFSASEFRTADFDTHEATASLAEKSIEEIGRGWTGIEASLDVEPVRLRRTFSSALKAFAKGERPGVLSGDLILELEVGRKSVTIVAADVRDFTTDRSIFEDPSPEVQSRVYRLEELFQERFVKDRLVLYPTGSSPQAGRVPVRIDIAYSPVSAFVLVGTVVLPLALLLAFVLAYWRYWGTRYEWVGEAIDGRPFRVRPSRVVRGSAGLMGTLHQVPPLIWFKAAGGWRVGGRESQRLTRDGGSLELLRKSDSLRVRLRLNRVNIDKKKQRRPASPFERRQSLP